MSKATDKKTKLLGMPIGTAANRLRKSVMFSLIVRLGENFCYRCGSEILSESDISIEHKDAWMQADNPKTSFFDLDNVSFSHLSCNVAAGVRPKKRFLSEKERMKAKRKRVRASLTVDEKKKTRRETYLRYGK